ncbi:uncharacterized protein [Apostichopus japonicus]|uniref:uncharacterized protein n=1 Tax=Stichopus japonicus TaxID=307972 RepID=UPI003AB67248
MDKHASTEDHITSVCRSAQYHLYNIGRIRKYLTREATEQLIHAFITLSQRIRFKVLLLVFKCQNNMAPPYLQDLIRPHQPTRALRSAGHSRLEVPITKTNIYGNRAFCVAGPRLWNELPAELKNCF